MSAHLIPTREDRNHDLWSGCLCEDCTGTLRPILVPEIEDEEPERCEADHSDGGVCLARLRPNGSCPQERSHR